jgi:hypothetical protein
MIGNAIHIMRIATCEVKDATPDDGKDKTGQAMGRKGGAAPARRMTPERRAEIAKVAVAKRCRKP